ncbi:MAG: bifunctional folylpolyglutamate synthase/dihydrofolate synthase [Candidatus Omnitrophica bacterium]|nr:bifunctional folylpolyglutamate synthase/dihydrofolate synthase [Candidatus Omnitrophota bacterium]
MTFEEALKYLEGFTNYELLMRTPYESAYKLQRMQELCSLVGHPEQGLTSVHIGGTKGKGSVAAMTESILRAAGFKTGLYISPHLVSMRERILICGRPIPAEHFGRLMGIVRDALKSREVNPRHGAYTFFELVTLAAFLAFREEQVDVAVLEVGLGGRLDATNVVSPLAVGLVPVSFDHASILGVTLEQIAREKCGIVKKRTPVISGVQTDSVMSLIDDTARERGCPVLAVERDIHVERKGWDLGGERFSCEGPWPARYEDMEVALLGAHQVRNAAIAIGLIEVLKSRGLDISLDAVRVGLKAVSWPGRLEVVETKPFVVLDGAQNVDSAQALVQAVKDHFCYRRLILILGMSQDKDLVGVGKTLAPLADEVIFTESGHPRAASADFLKGVMGGFFKSGRTVSNCEEALEAARRAADPEDFILVTGSLYLIGRIRKLLKPAEELEDVSLSR